MGYNPVTVVIISEQDIRDLAHAVGVYKRMAESYDNATDDDKKKTAWGEVSNALRNMITKAGDALAALIDNEDAAVIAYTGSFTHQVSSACECGRSVASKALSDEMARMGVDTEGEEG